MIENTVLTGIVMALCQVAKQYIESRWIPLIALGLGVIGSFGLAVGQGDVEPVKVALQGIISGLVAVGLYSGTKNTLP